MLMKDLKKILKRIESEEGPIGLDTETTGFSPIDDKIVGVCLSLGTRHGVYLPFRHETDSDENLPRAVVSQVIKAVVASNRRVVFHNAAFDLAFLNQEGWSIPNPIGDTMIAKWMLTRGIRPRGARPYSLKSLAKKELSVDMGDFRWPEGIQFAPMEDVAKYGADDAKRTLQLWRRYEDELKAIEGFWYEYEALEMPIVRVVAHMKRSGFHMDQTFIREVHDTLFAEASVIREKLDGMIGGTFPVTSTQGISKMMFDDLRWWNPAKLERGKNGCYSTAAHIIEAQVTAGKPRGRKVAEWLLRFRKLEKLRGTYTLTLLDRVDTDGRLRASFNQHGTATGRFSSSNPNLQNIPRPSNDSSKRLWERNLPPIRKAFVAAPGKLLVGIDYSQIELRLMAHYSRDPVMTEVYQSGGDIHQTTADACGCTRQDAKAVNFGLVYGMSAWSLAGQLDGDVRKAEKYHKGYFRAYSGVKRYHKRVERQMIRDGYVKTMTGRHRLITGVNEGNAKHAGAIRQAVNTTIQGSAADLMKIAMRNLHVRWEKEGILYDRVRMLSTIHDELIVEADEGIAKDIAAAMQHEFENAVTLRVPLVAEPSIGSNWLEAK